MPSDVQDALVTILSEKVLPVPELDTEVAGGPRASTSSPPPTTATAASTSCRARCAGASTPSCCRCRRRPRRRWRSSPAASASSARRSPCPTVPAAADEIRRVVTIFRELRDGRHRRRPHEPQGRRRGTLSTAEAISVVTNGLALAAHFGDGTLRADRRRRRHRRRGRPRPGARRRRLARVPRGGGPRPRRLGRLLRRLPRARLSAAGPADVPAAAPARHPPPRAGLGAVGACGRSTSCAPDVVLVEAPADADAALRWIGDAGLVPPVALLGYVVDQPERAVFAPLAAFSPEWQAVALGARARRAGRGDRPAAGRHARRRRRRRRRRRAAAAAPPSIRSARSPRRPASPTPSGGGRTSSSTAATASRRSTPSPRRWPRCATGTTTPPFDAPPGGAHAPTRSAPRSPPDADGRRGVRGVARAGARPGA